MKDQSELSALVVRNITDIEAAMNHATEVVGPRLWRSASASLSEACPDSWLDLSDSADEDVSFAEREWLIPGADPVEADFWIGLDQRFTHGGDEDNSWLATFTGSGPNESTLAFYVDQSIVKASTFKKLLKANVDLLARLNDAGFEFDEDDDRRLCLPVKINQELLAKGFEDGDLAEAMQPISQAVAKAIAAAEELNQLRVLLKGAA